MKHRAYVKGIADIRSYMSKADEGLVIHPTINTIQAVTGRESCENPNLQNVSKEESPLTQFPIPARRVFVPKPGYINLLIDFSGIEMKLIAHYSDDERLITMMNSGEDPHIIAAQAFYGGLFDHFPKSMMDSVRNAAKQGQYATAYGAGPSKLAIVLAIPDNEGRPALERYKREFPGVPLMNLKAMEIVRRQGYLDTVFGRRIFPSRMELHKSCNYLIQGTAADILKYSFNAVSRYLADETDSDVGIILPIHDELIIEFSRTYLPRLNSIIDDLKVLMTDFPLLKVPMAVKVSIATSCLADAKEYKNEG
jgi:DNA polymerase-1